MRGAKEAVHGIGETVPGTTARVRSASLGSVPARKRSSAAEADTRASDGLEGAAEVEVMCLCGRGKTELRRVSMPKMKTRKQPSFANDKRRKHHHWQVTVFYQDGERFARTYTDHKRAAGFADRQKKSPVVKGGSPY